MVDRASLYALGLFLNLYFRWVVSMIWTYSHVYFCRRSYVLWNFVQEDGKVVLSLKLSHSLWSMLSVLDRFTEETLRVMNGIYSIANLYSKPSQQLLNVVD